MSDSTLEITTRNAPYPHPDNPDRREIVYIVNRFSDDHITDDNSIHPTKRHEDMANLFSAAPEMLKALEMCVNTLHCLPGFERQYRHVRDAITKAKGLNR